MKLATLVFLILVSAAPAEVVSSGVHRFKVETIADGLERPWGLARLPDGKFLVTERSGRLLLIDGPGAAPRPIDGVPAVVARGQGGLLHLSAGAGREY